MSRRLRPSGPAAARTSSSASALSTLPTGEGLPGVGAGVPLVAEVLIGGRPFGEALLPGAAGSPRLVTNCRMRIPSYEMHGCHPAPRDRKRSRLNSSHVANSYAGFSL